MSTTPSRAGFRRPTGMSLNIICFFVFWSCSLTKIPQDTKFTPYICLHTLNPSETKRMLTQAKAAPAREGVSVSRLPLPCSRGCGFWREAHGDARRAVLDWQDDVHQVPVGGGFPGNTDRARAHNWQVSSVENYKFPIESDHPSNLSDGNELCA